MTRDGDGPAAAGVGAGVAAGVGMDTPLLTALGRTTAAPLAKHLDLHTVGDLLRHYPRKYVENAVAQGQPDRVVAYVSSL